MLYYPKIIIGSSLSALSTAFINEIPILSIDKENKKPLPFDYFDNNIDFKYLNLFYKIKTVNVQNYQYKIGLSKLLLYDYLSVVLSFLGLSPFSNLAQELEIDESKNLITIKTKGEEYQIQYETLYVFDSEKILWSLKPYKKQKIEYNVVDWIDVTKRFQSDYNLLEDKENNFVNKAYIYNVLRNKKNIVTVSYLTKPQLDDIQYSEYFVRRKLNNLLKEIGVDLGKDVLKYIDRQIRPIGKDLYQDCNSIKFIDYDENLIWENFSKIYNSFQINTLETGKKIYSYATKCCRLSILKKGFVSSCGYHPNRIWKFRWEKELFTSPSFVFGSR